MYDAWDCLRGGTLLILAVWRGLGGQVIFWSNVGVLVLAGQRLVG